MTTVHPSLAGGGEGGPIPWHPHDGEDLSGKATFLQVNVENLLAGTIDSKEIVISGGTDGVIRSDNYEAGVSGWAIFGDGSIEARSITIVAGAGSEVDWSFIQNVSIDNADINSLSFDKITAATNTASLVIGAGGSIESDNYSAGSAGFQITGAGDIEANDITARGVLISQAGSDVDWTHVSNVSVATADIENAAVTNAKIDSLAASKITAGTISTGTINVASLLQMSSGGTFQTAASGNRRIRLRSTVTDRIEFVSTTNDVRASLILNSDDELFIQADSGGRVILLDTNDAIHIGDPVSQTGAGLQVNSGDINLVGGGNLDISNGHAEITSPTGEVALTAYRPNTTNANDIAHFRSDEGGTDSPVMLVKVNGNLQNLNNSYGGISDARLKEDIETARPYLADLRKIRVTKHTLKATGDRLLGPIAQEVRKVFPGLVTESEWDGEKVLSVKHSVFVPMLLTAIQELADDRDDLEQRLSRLERAAA